MCCWWAGIYTHTVNESLRVGQAAFFSIAQTTGPRADATRVAGHATSWNLVC